MSFFKRLFGVDQTRLRTSASGKNPPPGHEDVRSNPQDEGEIILNLWYVTNRIVISSLRAKAYVASGSDEEKMHFLRIRANQDYQSASEYPIPPNLKSNVKMAGGGKEVEENKVCPHVLLEFMGGYPALFREIILNVPKAGFRFDPAQAMMCITALEKGSDGKLSVLIDKTTNF